MPCAACQERAKRNGQAVAESKVAPVPVVKASAKDNSPGYTTIAPQMAGRSKTNTLYRLRYMGGGMAAKRAKGTGCRTCGGGRSSYTVVTKEEIMFVSEDAPNGIYKEVVAIGHDYLVTEEQKKLMLAMTYRDMAGKEKHKFVEVNDGAND